MDAARSGLPDYAGYVCRWYLILDNRLTLIYNVYVNNIAER